MKTNKITECYKHYGSKTIPMCVGTIFEDTPWECVRLTEGSDLRDRVILQTHPEFSQIVEQGWHVRFATGILENLAVFEGDILYDTEGNAHVVYILRNGVVDPCIKTTRLTWTAPSPTIAVMQPFPAPANFILNGSEVPRPVKQNAISPFRLPMRGGRICIHHFRSFNDLYIMTEAIHRMLTKATKR